MEPQYDLIPLDSYAEGLKSFRKDARRKIERKVKRMLEANPRRYQMLKGVVKVRGLSFAGLRHMKVGVQGIKGGAYVLYRICEECRGNEYYLKSDARCKFCDDEDEDDHIVLFAVRPRSLGY